MIRRRSFLIGKSSENIFFLMCALLKISLLSTTCACPKKKKNQCLYFCLNLGFRWGHIFLGQTHQTAQRLLANESIIFLLLAYLSPILTFKTSFRFAGSFWTSSLNTSLNLSPLKFATWRLTAHHRSSPLCHPVSYQPGRSCRGW